METLSPRDSIFFDLDGSPNHSLGGWEPNKKRKRNDAPGKQTPELGNWKS